MEFHPGKKPWEVPGDVAMPCATQNELTVDDAVLLIANNVRYYVEGANMPATTDAPMSFPAMRSYPRPYSSAAAAEAS